MSIWKAFSPSHITGFFEVKEKSESFLEKGSLGAGVCLKLGVTTTVKVEKAGRWGTKVYINREVANAEVSEMVIREFYKLTPYPYKITVNHSVDVPIGAGFGTSGAGALSLALALNEALNVGLSKIETAQIAHKCELKCKTGLGTVIAETYGGVEIREKAGAPGVGIIKKIPVMPEQKVVSIFFGPMSTKSFLSNNKVKKKINEAGDLSLKHLLKTPTVECFLECSRRFADQINIYTPRLRKIISQIEKTSSTCFSMNLFGEALFSIVNGDRLPELLSTLNPFTCGNGRIIISDIDSNGARLVD
jgi:pantoate kinase